MENKYYSQCKQDKILNEKIFKNNKNGFYLDIGANHPTRHSNTYFFEKTLDWNGICIEPQEEMIKLLKEQRKCILVTHGVYNKKTELQFCTTVTGLSGIVETYDPRHIERINRESKQNNIENKISTLKVDTLENVLDKYNVKTVDYMSIDTEGSELEILQGINFKKTLINVIDIEDNYPDTEKSKKVHNFLLENNFNYIGNIEWDKIYVNKNKLFTWENKK